MNILQSDFIKTNETLSKHCTMRVGGKCDFFAQPTQLQELVDLIKFCKQKNIKYFILGNGSNVIFTDNGFKGVIISTKKLNKIHNKNNIITMQCGVSLYVLNNILFQLGLSGMEWSYGIPATVGGAVCMNAGAYDGQMKDVVLKVLVFDGVKTKVLYNNELAFAYRDSIIKQKNLVVLKVWLKLKKSSSELVVKKAQQYFNKRRLTQPLEFFNSGSIFKKYKEQSSGKIIDNLGLKSVTINGAQISNLHANFIINTGNAKCKDVQDLIMLIKNKAKQHNIDLQEEVIFVGD